MVGENHVWVVSAQRWVCNRDASLFPYTHNECRGPEWFYLQEWQIEYKSKQAKKVNETVPCGDEVILGNHSQSCKWSSFGLCGFSSVFILLTVQTLLVLAILMSFCLQKEKRNSVFRIFGCYVYQRTVMNTAFSVKSTKFQNLPGSNFWFCQYFSWRKMCSVHV